MIKEKIQYNYEIRQLTSLKVCLPRKKQEHISRIEDWSANQIIR